MNISTTAFGTENFNVIEKANIATTGNRLNITTDDVDFRIWTQVDPNANRIGLIYNVFWSNTIFSNLCRSRRSKRYYISDW